MSTAAAAAAAAAGTDEATARKRWELENNIQQVELDEIFKFDEKAVSTLLDAHPWRDEFVHNSILPLFFPFCSHDGAGVCVCVCA